MLTGVGWPSPPVGVAIPRWEGLSSIRGGAKQARGSKPVSKIPLPSLLQYLPPGFFLELLTWNCKPNQPFPPCCSGVGVLSQQQKPNSEGTKEWGMRGDRRLLLLPVIPTTCWCSRVLGSEEIENTRIHRVLQKSL